MKILSICTASPLLAYGAVLAPRAGSVPTGAYEAGVWKIAEGTDIFFFGNAINANAGQFWLGKNTTAYCPTGVDNLDCSAYATTSTNFVGGNGTLALNVSVPGGQQGRRSRSVRDLNNLHNPTG